MPKPTIPRDDPAFLARFWSKVDKSAGPDGCWLWTATTKRGGYGSLTIGRRAFSAHRISWVLTHGPVPDGYGYHGTCVLHRCDVRECVNPSHLWIGSNAENIADMCAKRRHNSITHPELFARGEAHGSRTKPECLARGEDLPQAKLTEAQVLEIRAMGASQREIAAHFGISQPTVSDIRNGKLWRHVR